MRRQRCVNFICLLIIVCSAGMPAESSDWEEDEKPYQQVGGLGNPVMPADSLNSGAMPGLNSQGQASDPQAVGSLASPTPLVAPQNSSSNWTNKVKAGAKAVAATPKQIAVGSGHLLKDPRFWTITAGGAALGAAGVGTYFLLKNANKQPEKQVYVVNPATGALVPFSGTTQYPYGFPNGAPAGVPARYPFQGYSSYPGSVYPGAHLVSGYTTKNGTAVGPYWQTNANGTMYDNFSTIGNTNIYTGQKGWIIPSH